MPRVDLVEHCQMNNTLPPPFVPENCNLGDFAFMPLDVRRLLSSETWILGTGDERAAAMCLWLESWHQVPAASIPDNDRMLAHLAQCSKWPKVREQALRGWVKCSDGRLYHKVVAEKALEAWIEKLLNSLSGATGNAKRWNVEIDTAGTKEEIVKAIELLKAIAPQSRALKKSVVLKVAAGSPPDKEPIAPRQSGATPNSSPPDKEIIAPRSSEDRNRQGEGQGQGFKSVTAGEPSAPPDRPDPPPEAPPASADETAIQAACRKTWHAYNEAYTERYSVPPVRNAKVNAQIKQFVQLLRAEDAPHVAAFYVRHSNAFYVKKGHDLGSLVADAGKLRTEWATGRVVTATGAQQVDRTQSNFNAANEAKRILASTGASA